VREQPGTRPSPLPTLALAAPLSRVAVAPLSGEATPPPPDGEGGICPKAGSIVISFLCGYGPLSSPRRRSARLKQYDKTVVTPDAAWEKIHEEFESALKSILLSTRLDLTLIGACPCSNSLLHGMKRACDTEVPLCNRRMQPYFRHHHATATHARANNAVVRVRHRQRTPYALPVDLASVSTQCSPTIWAARPCKHACWTRCTRPCSAVSRMCRF